MKKISLLVFMTLLVFVGVGSAEKWNSVGHDRYGCEWRYDEDSLKKGDDGQYRVNYSCWQDGKEVESGRIVVSQERYNRDRRYNCDRSRRIGCRVGEEDRGDMIENIRYSAREHCRW